MYCNNKYTIGSNNQNESWFYLYNMGKAHALVIMQGMFHSFRQPIANNLNLSGIPQLQKNNE